jgi:hypothetical protein
MWLKAFACRLNLLIFGTQHNWVYVMPVAIRGGLRRSLQAMNQHVRTSQSHAFHLQSGMHRQVNAKCLDAHGLHR